MKKLVFILMIFTAEIIKAQSIAIDRVIESEQVSIWRSKLAEASNLPPEQKYDQLLLGLRNMGYRQQMEGCSEDIVEIYTAIQKEILQESNHAQYFRNQINAMYDPVTNEPIAEKYYYQRHLIRETLCHIPSPEMVWLLGEMLEDERGKIDDPKNRLGATSNADWACSALMLIGLENMPVPRGKGMMPVESAYLRKDTWKLWWGPIKAGNRTFSFAGREVEYRFRKDGSYETISKNGVPKKSTKLDRNQPVQAEESKPRQRWLIFLSGCLVLLGWMWWKSKQKAS